MSRLDKFAVSLGSFVVNYKWLTVFLTIIVVFCAVNGAKNIGFDTNYRVFFSKENPQLKAFDELQAIYTKTDNVLFIIKPDDGDVFSAKALAAIQEITDAGWQLPFSTRVDSITNFQHTYASGDDLTVVDMVEGDPQKLSKEERGYVKDVVLKEPLLVDRLVSKDGKATGVNVTIYLPGKSIFEVPDVKQQSMQIIENIKKKYPGLDVRGSGMIFMNNAFSESSQNDMMTLVPLMYGLLIVAMFIFLRSFWATIATVFVIAFSAAAAMGIAGYMGIKLTPPSATAPTIILTLAIADSVHIIMSMFKALQRGMPKKEAIIESVRINLQPVFLTSLTTTIGFLSLNFSDTPPFAHLGNITAVGVCFAFVFSIFFLPAILNILPLSTKGYAKKNGVAYMERLAEFVIKYQKILLVTSLIVIAGLGSQISRIELNDEFVKYFDYSIPFRGDTEFMVDNLTGIYQAEFSIGSGSAEGISDPQYLQKLEDFSNWLREQPEVMHVYSITDIFKRLNKNMHGDEQSWYKLPDNREMAAQYLLLYEFSLPYGLDLNDRINVEKSSTRLTATLENLSTVAMREFKMRSEKWLVDNTPQHMHTNATSPVIMFSYISERNIDSMMKGNIIALVLISFIIMLALWSFKIGVVSLVPNVVPAVMGFGLWGILVGQVNMAVAIVAAVSLGIIVDDTVHFLSKYFRARRENGLSAEKAVKYAFNTVGSALLVTTLVLVVGFAVLMFSGFALNNTLGLLTAMTIACALIADYFLLPPILLMFDKKKGE